jgi:RHS repeat-associated protein
MEKDDELKGEGNSINYEARMQDTRVGRFLSIDPLAKSFPHYSPYQFAGNTPIQAIDLDGAEEYHYLASWNKKSGKIVFKLESEKTVYKKSFLGYTWMPKEEHIVVYQNSNGDETSYSFTKNGEIISYGGISSETVNQASSLRKFIADSNKIIYQNEDDAERTFSHDYLSQGGEWLFTAGNAAISHSQIDRFKTKKPSSEKNEPIDASEGKIIKTSKEYITVKKGDKTYHIDDKRVKEYVENPRNPKSNQGGDAVDFKKQGVPVGSERITGERSGKGHKRTPTPAEVKMYNENKLP